MIRNIVFAFVLVTSIVANAQNSTNDFFKKTDTFFKNYVKNGRVNYTKLARNTTSLKKLIALSNLVKVEKTQVNKYMSFWINVYNLGVIEQVLDNYPVNSPMKISGFFDSNIRTIGGKKITLNDIENKLLRGNFKEPRFHFVLVCGAVSCPPIVNYAYTPENIEHQLEKQTKLAMNNDEFIRTANGETKISEIFLWYKQDFGNSKTNIVAFVNKYRKNKIKKDFGYYTYNWQLNSKSQKSINKDLKKSKASLTETLSNVQTFTPSKLLAKHQFDLKFFNSLYTQTRKTTEASSQSIDIPRESFFVNTTEAYIGVSKNARINIGLIVQTRSNTTGDSNVSSVFKFENNFKEKNGSRFGVSAIAPSIRLQPFASISNFSVTSSLYFSVFEEGKAEKAYLDKKSTVWETKFFYDHTFGGSQWQVFTEVDLAYNFGDKKGLLSGEDFANNSLGLPISTFLSYFPTNKSTIYVNAQQFFLIDLGNKFEQNYTSVGVGGKYQLTNSLNLEVSIGKFIRGYNFQGLGQTFSLGLRFLSPN